jgi:protein involved in polysaccharide export with SLBB domain
MIRVVIALVCLFALACTSEEVKKNQAAARERAAALQEPAAQPEYRLAPGDLITIKFYYTPEFNEQMPVRPDGNISLQLVGDVQAAGRTVEELRRDLAAKYAGVMKHTDVAVIVNSVVSQNVFVGGEVNRPGIVSRTPGMTALQALIAAGGFRNTAELRNVVILRDQGSRQPLFLMADLREGLKSLASSNDLPLQARDIVFVPTTTIADVDDFVSQYITKVIPFTTTMGLQYNFGSFTAK